MRVTFIFQFNDLAMLIMKKKLLVFSTKKRSEIKQKKKYGAGSGVRTRANLNPKAIVSFNYSNCYIAFHSNKN